jgi:hypothetical protein
MSFSPPLSQRPLCQIIIYFVIPFNIMNNIVSSKSDKCYGTLQTSGAYHMYIFCSFHIYVDDNSVKIAL